jgi:hypothetical protein
MSYFDDVVDMIYEYNPVSAENRKYEERRREELRKELEA